jgi:D-proline reductase (dithiol) PrdB
VGLVQRAIEAAGISTITLSTIPDFTASVGVPRIAAIEHPLGRPFGQAGDAEGQRAVLRATLRALADIDTPGGRVDLPFEWPQPPGKARSEARQMPPIASLMMRKPWLLARFIAGDIPDD